MPDILNYNACFQGSHKPLGHADPNREACPPAKTKAATSPLATASKPVNRLDNHKFGTVTKFIVQCPSSVVKVVDTFPVRIRHRLQVSRIRLVDMCRFLK